jgi:hypothetical protein
LAARSLSWTGEPFHPLIRASGIDQVALALVEVERLADRGPDLGRPSTVVEHDGQLEQGVGVLVEEVGPGRQRDRRAGQRLGLLELAAGGQDPRPEPLSDHLGGQVLASGRLPARLDEPLRLVGAALGRERLG